MSPGRAFTFDGRFAFLTYPRSGGLTRERLRDFLQEDLGADAVHIVSESHRDGTPHLHALCRWPNRRRFTGERVFDCDGRHPNISKPRSIRDVANYIEKSGVENVLSTFEPGCLDDLSADQRNTGWRDALAAPTRGAFLDRVRELSPRDFVLSHGKLLEFCAQHYAEQPREYSGRGREQFREPESLTRWVSGNLEVTGPGGPQSPPYRLRSAILSCLLALVSSARTS